jgi:NAD(P)-dependent dehydrogenase (short-subunit alcohol dehydrogenase family)
MKLADKTALVTGGNSGIGRGIVHRFAREGARCIIIGRDEAKGAATLAGLACPRPRSGDPRAGHVFLPVDLSREEQVIALLERIEADFALLDVIVNNAGAGSRRGGIEDADTPGTRWEKLRGANLDSGYFVSAYGLPLMARGGAIVNISSTATFHGNWGLYGIAKAGVEAMTRSFAAEAAPHGIRVNCVSPGWIATEQDKAAPASGSGDGAWAMPPSLLGRMGTVDEIAAAVLFLASDEASFVTGQTLVVDGGMMVIDYPSVPLLDKVGHRLYSQPHEDGE